MLDYEKSYSATERDNLEASKTSVIMRHGDRPIFL